MFIDNSFLNKDLSAFLRIGFWGILIFVLSFLFNVIESLIKNRIRIKIKLDLSRKFIRKFYSLDMAFLYSASGGENIYRLYDIDNIVNYIIDELPRLLIDILKVSVIIIISFYISQRLTIFFLALTPLFIIRTIFLKDKIQRIHGELWISNAGISRKVYESMANISIVKALGLESFQRYAYARILIENIRLGLQRFKLLIAGDIVSTFSSKIIFGIISLYGGWLIIRGVLSIGSYTALMLYLTQLGGSLQSLTYALEYFMQRKISLEKFSEIIEREPSIIDSSSATKLNSINGEIRFRDVYFGYEKSRPIFKAISLSMSAKQWIAITGPSGCGKTTLVNLILRLYEPWSGSILLDGLDLKDIRQRSLRENISIATQEPLLFNLSIKDNITYGLKHILEENIVQICGLVQIHDFILKLPQQYNTPIGEKGYRLSQGYKQRIALARALIREPDLLILDEATSSIDSASEERILRAIREMRAGRSTIIISHRLSTIRDADNIFYLSNDGTIEEGLHSELILKNNYYRENFKNQMEQALYNLP